jgi:hypothetical protein
VILRASPRRSWDIPSRVRRRWMRDPTCTSMGLGRLSRPDRAAVTVDIKNSTPRCGTITIINLYRQRPVIQDHWALGGLGRSLESFAPSNKLRCLRFRRDINNTILTSDSRFVKLPNGPFPNAQTGGYLPFAGGGWSSSATSVRPGISLADPL